MRRRRVTLLLLGCWLTAPAFAQPQPERPDERPDADPPPEAAAPPATPEAPAAPDPSEPEQVKVAASPKEALKLLNEAMRRGDPAQIRAVMYATSPAEVRMVGVMAEMSEAVADLHRSAVKAFGAAEARTLTGDADALSAQGQTRIDSADVTLHGESATVVYVDKSKDEQGRAVEKRSSPIALLRTGRTWKVRVSQFAPGVSPDALERRVTELEAQTRIVRETAREVAAGRYTTAEQAREAWHSKLMQSLTPRPPREKGDDKVKG